MQNEILSKRIKEICKQKKIPIKTLLEECGMNRNTIYDLEKKQVFPASDKISRIADHLEVSIDYLLGRTDDPEQKTEPTPPTETEKLIQKINLLTENEKQLLAAMIDGILQKKQPPQ